MWYVRYCSIGILLAKITYIFGKLYYQGNQYGTMGQYNCSITVTDMVCGGIGTDTTIVTDMDLELSYISVFLIWHVRILEQFYQCN